MADEHGDKTELPTDRRRQEMRERGNVARSVDLNTAVSVLAAATALNFLGPDAVSSLIDLLRKCLTAPVWTDIDSKMIVGELVSIGILLVRGVGPLFALMLLSSVAINLAQVGFLVSTESLQPNLSRINPLEGFKRIFSMQGIVRLVGSAIKLIVLTAVVAGFISAQLPLFLRSADLETVQICRQTGESLISLSFQLALALGGLALLDYGFQWWKFEQDLKMTKEEVREEMRHMEGDPHIRQRRKEAHRKLTDARQLQQVKTADVVVTNPTEFAVALKYDAKKMAAPIVVAKGADAQAQRIRRVAAENGVPIVEKKPLARALYRDVKVGQPVPVELYEAVAEILAYVYRLNAKQRKRA